MEGFESELMAAFSEVSAEVTGTPYTLGNANLNGTITSAMSVTRAFEPGYESQDEIAIVSTRDQFSAPPKYPTRQIVVVLSGPYKGKWTVTGVNNDAAHYTITCKPSE